MKKRWLLAITMALVLAVAGLSGCSWGAPEINSGSSDSGLSVNLNSQQEGIWVSGTGKVSVVPDLVTLSLGIEAQADTVAEAQSQAAAAMDSVLAALKEQGVANKDIQTQYYSIYRVTRWDNDKQEEVVTGYRVTNMVTVKTRDMEKIGEVIDAVALAGGDLTRINNISFSVEDPTAYYDEVRAKAVADARAKAEQLADLAGVKLGKATYISEGSATVPVVYRDSSYYGKAEAVPAVETPISAGELEISLSVQITYAIAD